MSKFLEKMFKWSVIGISVGTTFNIGWAIIFWNNDNLFMWHWLGVPIGMLITAYGRIDYLISAHSRGE